MGRTRRFDPALTRQRGLFDPPRGGARPGAGRKRKKVGRRVPHAARERVTQHHAVHVTQRVDTRGYSMRTRRAGSVLRACFAKGARRFGFRLVEYSIQRDHMHLIVEADDTRALSRGMQGLKVRIARALNRLWKLTGRRFTDRYHAHVLKKLREVRNALNYVLNDARHHGYRLVGIDPYSSGDTFDGWRETQRRSSSRPRVIARVRSWLIKKGWRCWGLLSQAATPGSP